MIEENYLGCYDNQTDEEKSKNYKQSDIVASVAPAVFPVKELKDLVNYPIRSQGSSSRCVTFTYAKELSIWFLIKYGVWIDFSTCFLYQQRNNKELLGCSSVDIYTNFPKLGDIFEMFMPGDGLGEKDALAIPMPPYAKDLAKVVEVKRISLPIDFDTVASTLSTTGKGAMLWFHFNRDEWKEIPVVSDKPWTSGHSITAIEPITYKGEQYISCEESWGINSTFNGKRLISREYFNARCYQASYVVGFKFAQGDVLNKPRFDGTIISAQECFQWLGYFPTNVQKVENWGPITRSACKKFQLAYGITPPEGNFGPLTKAKLIDIFNL